MASLEIVQQLASNEDFWETMPQEKSIEQEWAVH